MRMLSHDVLIDARRVYEMVDSAMELRRRGHEAQAWASLSEAHALILSGRPVLEGVIRAQTQAAQALNLTQGAGVGIEPEEQPHAANDHLPASEQPASPVA